MASAAARSASPSSSPVTASSSAPARGSSDTELTLRFNGDSYAEVYDATGKRLLADVVSAHTVRTVHGRAPLKVMLGNGPGVGVEINGHRAAIESAVGGNGEAHFSVQKDGRLVKGRGG
jgi:cytoskeleton protein RodZ